MELPSSETGDNMPIVATDSTPITHEDREDVTDQSLVYNDSAK
jgi:hypothetical protein